MTTNNTDGAALLPVTQSDRDAAADYIGPLAGKRTEEKLRSGRSDHTSIIQAFARHRISHSLPGDVGMRSAFPESIGRLTLGERLSSDHYCGGSHEMPNGHPVYWQQRGGEYPDDIEGFCLACAIDNAESEAGWCECSAKQTLSIAENDAARDLVAMLTAGNLEEGCRVFDHTPEEIGLHVMENHADILAALTPSALSGDAGDGALRAAIAKIAPITVHMGEEYAEVFFADGQSHSTQAMTMNPQDWLDIQAAYEASHQGAGE